MKEMLEKLKMQLILFFYAISYFTRLPIPASISFDNEQFHKANAYLPIVGSVVALFMIFVFYLSQFVLPINISVILMLIAGVLLTGALHEDGFADCCDGLGGGYDATQCLKIMKDSQIGTYGAIALVSLVLLKVHLFIELASLGITALIISLLVAHSLSRFATLCLMQTLHYVRLENGSKVKSLATRLDNGYFLFASLFAALCAVSCLLLIGIYQTLCIMITIMLVIVYLRHLFFKRLQGYTGDCLGFAQQCLEVTILLLMVAFLI